MNMESGQDNHDKNILMFYHSALTNCYLSLFFSKTKLNNFTCINFGMGVNTIKKPSLRWQEESDQIIGVLFTVLWTWLITTCLSWLETVPCPFQMKILMGHYNHPLLVDAKLMVSKIYPIIGEHIAVNFVAK